MLTMDRPSSAEHNSLWSPGGKSVSRRHLRDDVRTVKLDDRQVRILPKYRRKRRRQRAVHWSSQLSSVHCIDDAMTALNGSVVQTPTTAARRWKDAASKTVKTQQAWSSVRYADHHEVDLSAEICPSQPLTSISDDEDLDEVKRDGVTAVDFSGDEDYDADVDEDLNASSRLMLSRIIASKLRAALPKNATREISHIDEHDICDSDDEEDVTVRQRVARCCVSFLSFLASTVGLTCLLVIYTLLGGALFVGLEAQHERLVKTAVMTTRDQYVSQLWNITEQLNVLHPDNWSKLADQVLERYAEDVYVATKKRGWDGREDGDQQWSFAGGLLYSVTVVTTIGTRTTDQSMPA